MRDANTRSNAQGVGTNPIFAWGRITMKNAAEPVLVHGLGLSVKRTEPGKWLVTIDGGVRPRIFTPLVQAFTTPGVPPGLTGPVIADFNETAGTFVLTGDDTLDGVHVSIVVFGAGP